MITALEAIRLAKEIGGKDGLNCIAELDEKAAAEQSGCTENAQFPPLFGVPVLVKDNIDVKGFHTTAGSLALEDNIAQNDAPVIRNLRRNGAVIIGKSNMTEFANFVSTKMPGGYSSRGGKVIHAVKPELDPLGSSTGSAVAVAAGIVPMAVGTDTCHSVTACAMGNGICGLKPPAGVLSQEGIIPISKTFDSAGAMAQNVRDTLKLYSAMRDEPLSEIKPAPAGELRIAVNTANSEMNPEERKRFLDKVVETLKNSGAAISEVDEPPTPELPAIMKREFGPGLAEYLGKSVAKLKTLKEIVEYFEAHPDTMMKYGYDLMHGALYDESQEDVVEEEYQKAMKSRANQIKKVTEEIKDYDAVLITGPTYINHLCGLPTITVASGSLDSNGVRQAVMLYGTDEYRLYSAALTVEQLLNLEEKNDSIVIKLAETDEELCGRGYVHCTSWQEAYRGIVCDRYLDTMTVEATTARARKFPENTLVAKDKDKVVGFAVYGPSRDEDLKNAGEVVAIYVLKEYYNKKIGYRLMNEAISRLSEYNTIFVWVLEKNERAIRFYHRYGFEFDGCKKEWTLGKPVSIVRMIKKRE